MEKEKFGNLLKKIRQERKLSYRKLAKLLGLSHGTLRQYELGKNFPSFTIQKKLSKEFNLDLKAINLLIRTEKEPAETKGYYQEDFFTQIRRILLAFYSEGYGKNYASLKEIKNELENYPFHPIEKILLAEIHKKLVQNNLAMTTPDADPVDFFRKLTFEGKRTMCERAKFEWTWQSKKQSILFNSYSLNKPGESTAYPLFVGSGFVVPRMPTIRLILIDLFLLKNSEFKKSFIPYLQPIIKEIDKTFFHPIEEKILVEAYQYLSKIENGPKCIDYRSFFTLPQYEGDKRLKEVLKFWHYDPEKKILTIAFKGEKNKSILVKKFALWNELSK